MTKRANRLPGGRIRLQDGTIITEGERQRFRRAKLINRSDDQIIRDRIARHPDGTKLCKGGCNRELPFHQFAEFRREGDGLHRHCFSCRAERRAAHEANRALAMDAANLKESA